MYLIFDTETTGLPRDYNAPVTDLENWPRLVQLSWQLHGAKGELLSQHDYIVKPEGFTIPFNSEKVHGISTEKAHEQGHPLEEVLATFEEDLKKTTWIVGHNIDFDIKIVGAETVRKEVSTTLFDVNKLDTKNEATNFCQLPGGRNGQYKWPNLSELHHKLFGEYFEDAHNSAFDVDATARCFFGLIKEEVIAPLAEDLTVADIQYEQPDLEASKHSSDKDKEAADTDQKVEISQEELIAFSHLHVHTQYSILQSTVNVNAMVSKAAELGMKALAVTDHGNMFGIFKAVAAGKKEDVQVIPGCEVYLVEDRHQKKFTKDFKDRRFNIPLLAKNQNGYKNLCKLTSMGYIEGYYAGYPRVDKELIAQYKTDLMAFTGGLNGEIPYLILNEGEFKAEEVFQWWHQTFGDDFYIELMDHGLEEEKRVNQILSNWAEKYGVSTVATNNVYYIEQADASAHDTLLCIDANDYVSTPIGRGRGYRYGFPNNEYYFKGAEEMNKLFHKQPEALENIQKVLEKCEPVEVEREILLPNYEIPEGFQNQDEYLRHLSFEGAKERFGEVSQEVEDRLNHELKIIQEMGFPGYFLIVQDFINEAKRLGVAVGPGRGSGAGSLVAFCTGITNIDPLFYNLLFERFLNPERVSMPDFDIDFDDDGRQQVIDYVVNKYGKNQVAHIITFGTLAPKGAIKDAARVMEMPFADSNNLAKLVPDKPGTTFEQAYESSEELQKLRKQEDISGKVLHQAEILVGSARSTGIHAAGIIIAPDDLLEYIPVKTDKDVDLLITQYDGSVVEDAGMLKMDFLGLKTLTVIKEAIRMAEENHNVKIDPDEIPMDDEMTFQLYQRGETVGTFQFESEGMRMYLQQLQPNNIEDLIAMNALYRPGPMQFIPNFIKRKHGEEEVDYPHPLLEDTLKNTFGIMVYQEQIMQTAQIMAGYSLGGADILRRAMGKKKLKEMERQREIFIQGAWDKHGIEKAKAEEVFGVMEKFAEYGFNRSHSAAYSVVAYQTGYMKANYPAEYMASVLTHNMSNIDKVTFFMEECRRMGIQVLGPDVNESSYYFSVNADGQIRFGLGAIKGAGEAAIDAIIQEREKNGHFQDIFGFAGRVNLRAVNKKTFESLAKAGAFDCFQNGDPKRYHRKQYLVEEEGEPTLIEKAVRYANQRQQEEASAQQSLFGDAQGVAVPLPKVPETEPYSDLEKLKIEKEVIGFYLSGHPLDSYRLDLKSFCTCTLDEVQQYKNREINVAGIVTSFNERETKKGNPFGLFTLEDYQGSQNMALFGEDYLAKRHLLAIGQFVFVTGKVQQRYNREDQWELRPQNIQLLNEIREKKTAGVELSLPVDQLTSQVIDDIEALIQSFPGQHPVQVILKDDTNQYKIETMARNYKISPENAFFEKLEALDQVDFRILSN